MPLRAPPRQPLGAALVLVALLLSAVVSGCLSGTRRGEESYIFGAAPSYNFTDVRYVDLKPYQGPTGSLAFIVLGDTGYGNDNQYRVAHGIGQVCAQSDCAFVVGTGDNIYNTGVTSLQDAQWWTKFEAPYRDLDLPFYQTLGNHDVGSTYEYDPRRGDIQVAYTNHPGRPSDKWHMPARTYTMVGDHVQFFMLDTPTLTHWQNATRPEAAMADDQATWTDTEMLRGVTPWRFAVGHHHYITNGLLNDAGSESETPARGKHWKQYVDERLCGNVDMVLLGHDHTLQWLKPPAGCGRTSFLISGGGSSPKALGTLRHDAHFQTGGTLGFFRLQIDGPTLLVEAYDDAGNLLYAGLQTKPVR